jgi:hypothetical protein
LGWVVESEDFDPDQPVARPVSANIKIRPADGTNQKSRESVTISSVDNEETEVTNVAQHAQRTRDTNKEYRRVPNRAKMAGEVQVEPQDGVALPRTFKTAAKTTLRLDGKSTADEIERLNNVKIEAQVKTKKAVKGRAPASIPEAPVVLDGDIEFGLTSTQGASSSQVIEAEGIKFTTTNGPKKDLPNSKQPQDDVRRKVAKTVCRDFPDLYNFNDSDKKKLARIQADFDERPDVIRAIFAAESDNMKARLVEEFPEAFS